MRKSATGVVTFPHVLVPIDLSEQSSRTLRIVGTLPASRVTLLHVIHRVPGLRATEFRGFYARLRRRAEQVVERAAGTLAASGLRVSQVVTIGDPAREIVRLAAARRADLVVLGSHRIAPGPGQGLGTISYKVAIACSCPVLLVK
jgi:nucleotide-binding universal stress UspA family protein